MKSLCEGVIEWMNDEITDGENYTDLNQWFELEKNKKQKGPTKIYKALNLNSKNVLRFIHGTYIVQFKSKQKTEFR